MVRRWHVFVLAVLAVLALACEGAGEAGDDPSAGPKPPARSGLPNSMAALGDSITAGFGSCLTLLACERNAWSTGGGKAVESHYRRILADNPKIRGNAENFAVPGAHVTDLPGQADQAVAMKAEYVTVLIGANDACARRVSEMTSPARFRRHLDTALQRLKKGLPKTRVLVVSIPDLYRLWEIGHTEESAVRAWNRGVCPSMLANPTSTADADEDRRRAVAERVDAYNDELRAACRAYGDRCRWDGGRAHRVRFSLDLVNQLDYFHPNAAGQAELADTTYPGRFTW